MCVILYYSWYVPSVLNPIILRVVSFLLKDMDTLLSYCTDGEFICRRKNKWENEFYSQIDHCNHIIGAFNAVNY